MLLLMAVYWCTETLPLAVTSLIPLFLAPVLSILKAGDVAKEYLKDLNVMFMGGLMIAVVIEHSQLHRRISLGILRKMGTNPRFLMLGFMLPTWFLSMWISNTATTAMMLAIVQAVIDQLSAQELNVAEPSDDLRMTALEAGRKVSSGINNNAFESSHTMSHENEMSSPECSTDESERKNQVTNSSWESTSKALSLCVCYAATCGGIATLTGSAPNIILGENVNRLSEQYDYNFGFDFVSWLGFGFPISLLMVVTTWLWLQLFFIGFRGKKQSEKEKLQIKTVINNAYESLGPFQFKEVLASGHFLLLAGLWITRNPGGVGGWGSLFDAGYVSDATAVMFVAILVFMWPSERPTFSCYSLGTQTKQRKPLVTWEAIVHKVPWGLLLLLGGGFALAKCIEVSGLSKILGESLNFFAGWPTWGVVMCLGSITAFITEITSNATICIILLPIVASVTKQLNVHPFYLMLPVTACSSFAFMLPVATPPNALVFATGVLSIKDMAKAGFALNIIGICVATLATMTWGSALFHLDKFTYPQLNITNTTTNSEILSF
ncbi:solute carrier family 13 member 2-like [Watersipora subatra]|uniref:solute carrier family 13 member 2-like n=1 Tax=Watersipora subatra TaxID=2589382 RepID=UPI00355C7191